MSLGDPNAWLQMIIWTSSGSWEVILKNLLVYEWAVLSLTMEKESE